MRKVKLTYDPKTGKRGIPKLWGNMSGNSEEDDFLPENTVCSECEKLKKEFDFTTTLDDNDTKPVYQKDGFICSKCGEKKYFLPPHNFPMSLKQKKQKSI